MGSGLDPLIAAHLAIDEVLNIDDFTADAVAISDARSRIIAIDERQELIHMAWRRKNDIDFYFEDTHLGTVLQAKVHQGDKPGFGSDFNNRIIVPGIMAGFSADGALVGALAADDLRYVTHVSLVLAVDDVSEPLREMNFLDEPVLVGSTPAP